MRNRYREEVVRVTTTGSPGAATGSALSGIINGEVVGVHVNYDPSAPATTTVDVDEDGGAARKILDKAASATDAFHYPRVLMQDTTGANLTGVYERIVLAGRRAKVTVAASDALAEAVVVTLIIKEE